MKKRVLVVDDEDLIRWSLKDELTREGYTVLSVGTAAEAIEQLSRGGVDVTISDINLGDGSGLDILRYARENLPSMPVVLMTAYGDVNGAVDAMRSGAAHYISKPFDLSVLRMELEKVCETSSLRDQVLDTQERRRRRYNFGSIITGDEGMKRVISEAVMMAANPSATVLIQGESGTGKDLMARALHYESPRAGKPFLEISCTAIPENLLESELFGYEKGAFTDAKGQKKGFFDTADGGTVFLNEIGHMPLTLQAKLLRVIEDKVFMRLGGTEETACDVRIIAATNEDLQEAVRKGGFRGDLYFRLNVLSVSLPPLRERKGDILPLAGHFLARFSGEMRKDVPVLSEEAQAVMTAYRWPGNIRELRNVMERVMILGAGREIAGVWMREQIGKTSGLGAAPSGEVCFRLPPEGISLEAVEKDFIRQALESAGGNQVKAARLLGISRDALRYRLEKHGLRYS
ncbi:MAG: sigma-54 dependent transcriptional regulator [Elusimicrobia bacterium]|nr:sigma-54 dependent transcriptional regulator [Elusimicrobiota bacterium]